MPIIIGDSSETGDVSQVDVCNLALRRLGAKTISSISEATKMAEHCLEFWTYVLDEVSGDHQWNFLIKVVALDYTAGGYLSGSCPLYSIHSNKFLSGLFRGCFPRITMLPT